MIDEEVFNKLDIRVGQIIHAESIPKTHRLYKLTVDIVTDKIVIVAGLARLYERNNLVGMKVVVLTNITPKKISGIESSGIILGIIDHGIITIDRDISTGSKIIGR